MASTSPTSASRRSRTGASPNERRPFAHRQHAARGGDAVRHRAVQAFPQAREPESRRLDQGPHRTLDDRGRRARWKAEAGRHDRRGHRGQHRTRAGTRCRAQGLPVGARHPRQDEPGESVPSEGVRRGSRDDALRRRQGPRRLLPGPRGEDREGNPRGALREPVRQPRQSARARDHDRPRDLGADESQPRRCRLRRGQRRHHHRAHALLPQGRAECRDGVGRPRGLDPRRLPEDRKDRRSGLVAGRRHRRGFHSSRFRFERREGSLQHHRRRKLFGGARAAREGEHLRRILHRHAACCCAQILPLSNEARAGRHLRVRQRQQVPLEDVQRLLARRSGLPRARQARRPARPDRSPRRGARRGERGVGRYAPHRLRALQAPRRLAAPGARGRGHRGLDRRVRRADGGDARQLDFP